MGASALIKEQLLEKAKDSTTSPGVYRMLDKDGKILYIGKAKNLRNRVSSYFQDKHDDDKTKVLVSKIRNFELLLTDSESEALILEAILIKKYKPRYNIALKDDKSYPYVVVDENHSFPKLIFTRRPKKKNNVRVFGPFAVSSELRNVVRYLTQNFQLRDCSDAEFTNRSRPCLNFQIGTCSAPCTAQISAENYHAELEKALSVLSGKGKEVIRELEQEMEAFAESEEFEKAAKIRDRISFLESTLQTGDQKVTRKEQTLQDIERDAIGWHRLGDSASISLLIVRHGQLIDSTSFHFDGITDKSNEEIFFTFLTQYYLTQDKLAPESSTGFVEMSGTERKLIPREILLPFSLPEQDLFAESLINLGFKTELILPQRGDKADLLAMANKNAENAFLEHQRDRGNIYRTLAELKSRLRLENYPRRMECFDISNLGDTGIVASQVVFIEGKPDKTLYRHYKIREQESQNDFAAMREVLARRLAKLSESEEKPDLIIVDGGKGQLSMAVEVMKELNITGIDLVSLAKAKASADFDGREVQKTFERVYKPGRSNPIALAPDSAICHLMERIRDEAHRFAVGFQRKQRDY